MASPKTAAAFADDEIFDFDGEAGGETALTGVKREFADLDDDEEELYPTKKIYASHGPSSDHATTTILNLRSSLEDRDSTITSSKASLDAANAEVEKWTSGFANDSLLPSGVTDPAVVVQAMQKLQASESQLKDQTSLIHANEELGRWKHAFITHSILPPGIDPDPTVVVQAIQKLQSSEVQLQEQLVIARKREGVMLFNLANSEQEILGLKSTVRSLKRLSKRSLPSMVRPLLPKPSNFDEISRWKKELEPAEKITTDLPDSSASVQMRQQAMHDRDMDAECSAVSTENLGAGCEASEGKDEDGLRLISAPPSNSKKKVGRPRKFMVAKEEEEGEEGKKNWMDSEVETLISLRWEMEPDFLKNAYKQGVDMWAQLQARMSSIILGFSRSGLACQRKFNSLIKQHKKDILEVKEGKHHTWDRHARKFFDSLDRWWHTNGTIMKFATTKSNNMSRFDGDAAHLSGNIEHSARVKEDEEGEEAKKNWLDSEVETMVSLRWEMELEFVENAYKPGEDMWSKLQIRMMSLIPGFTRSSLACQRKFNALIKQHKKDVLDLKEFGRDHHSYKFYDLLDRWWHTNGTVMKHVTASLHESESLGNHLEYMEDAADKFIGEEDDEEGEESKKNWADSEVETLIALRREMDAEFVKNWKKQGGNMWSKLRSRMSSLYPGFSRSPIACKRKFNTLVRQYKKDMHAMDASGEERHHCKHHGLLDQWFLNSNGSAVRHNNYSSNNNYNNDNTASRSEPDVYKPDHAEGSLVPYEEDRELENGDSILGSLTKIVQASNENIVLGMAKPSCSLLDKMDAHMDPLIDNLKLTVSK